MSPAELGGAVWAMAVGAIDGALLPRLRFRLCESAWIYRLEWLGAGDAEDTIIVWIGAQAKDQADPMDVAQNIRNEACAMLERAWIAAQRKLPCSE